MVSMGAYNALEIAENSKLDFHLLCLFSEAQNMIFWLRNVKTYKSRGHGSCVHRLCGSWLCCAGCGQVLALPKAEDKTLEILY